MRWRRCGEDAALLDCDSLEQMRAAHATVLAARPPGVVDLVPGARSLLVVGGVAAVRALLEDADLAHPPADEPREVTLDVRYDGEDLALIAADAGVSPDAVVSMHTEAGYTVAFTGFAPGFGYLTGLPRPLRQPRLESPRTRVPAGSVGLAGEFTGVYPRESPGGWRLLGHTSATLFDPHADPPALFAPGDRVRFRSVR
ncbi:allophanate hydrolase subunit 1 [Amycolatopsis mediterranei S699]|uniref:Allophanate hydrolase subunit 1 n=2 Tax=Amycolatopsis mediterranei TaxID=33910 RepID=A0A0H3DIK5_AMYMU|nr:allophanate hydrolase subunit 1 [Amycolatopsis mediterranei]ADJ50705.1 allophanate hydrolase subunit 1 [Amycolatopsis mediterranei U32]AEK47714.1 allophanate hydrolase subunit 1 [Amycolatopsis mediterranei S699]AFO82411.1 allophanate hydrolase subunit 1 [Amycolatopsis mediterranei S699]AGT89540.1 allophanate hydrolase subunit 1 [Amycolatopsis mediterranei RB]KDO12302.1 allophanate hydrolase [Amycolatopsis mediterranei]